MKGSDGLKPGDVIHLVPEVNDVDTDDPGEYDTRAVVVLARNDEAEHLCYVTLTTWARDKHLGNAAPIYALFLGPDTEWFASQAEANAAAAAGEEDYGRKCLRMARRLRGESPEQ